MDLLLLFVIVVRIISGATHLKWSFCAFVSSNVTRQGPGGGEGRHIL